MDTTTEQMVLDNTAERKILDTTTERKILDILNAIFCVSHVHFSDMFPGKKCDPQACEKLIAMEKADPDIVLRVDGEDVFISGLSILNTVMQSLTGKLFTLTLDDGGFILSVGLSSVEPE